MEEVGSGQRQSKIIAFRSLIECGGLAMVCHNSFLKSATIVDSTAGSSCDLLAAMVKIVQKRRGDCVKQSSGRMLSSSIGA